MRRGGADLEGFEDEHLPAAISSRCHVAGSCGAVEVLSIQESSSRRRADLAAFSSSRNLTQGRWLDAPAIRRENSVHISAREWRSGPAMIALSQTMRLFVIPSVARQVAARR